ncbi:retropepsin-like aspartic protease [Halobacillus sp. BAB-2008]|uniref:retropepsin-like aspartic protease n=1 Tax=Halobacillus sp. BAB-2008 TaxID=1246484 RepID=UPI0002A5050A|nr:retropepsin-like aspartic protease [Halobacillus sp. BAB-2008]ELK48112.1 hypothetical protein D479_04343 [Halobacillus sp. BAB-2008]
MNLQAQNLHSELYNTMGYKEVDFKEVKFTKIRLKKNLWNLYTLNIVINDTNFKFLIDTASQISIIRHKVKANLEIESLKRNVKLKGFGGENLITKAVVIDKVKLGANLFNHVLFFMKEDSKLFKFLRIDGILGWDFLSRLDFSIDDLNKNFTIYSESDLERFELEPHSKLTVSRIPIIEAEVGNIVGIDLGANKSWVSKDSEIIENNPFIRKKRILSMGINGINIDKKGYLKEHTITLSNLKIVSKKLAISNTNFVHNVEIDLMMGTDTMRNKKITFLNSQGKLLISN